MTCFGNALYGQILELNLDGSLEGRAGTNKIVAQLGPGAKFVPSAEGQGVMPGTNGPAVIVPVPDDLWRDKGTLAFRFQASRTIRFTPWEKDMPSPAVFLKSPLFHAELGEESWGTQIRIFIPGKDPRWPGVLDLSHLKGGQWYHFAIAWDYGQGRLEAYLNGTMQTYVGYYLPPPWKPIEHPSGALALGGVLGQGESAAKIAVDSIQLYPDFLDEESVKRTLAGRPVDPLEGEGRTVFPGQLDISEYKRELVYEADFSKPLNVIKEQELFRDAVRIRRPEGKEWVFEGAGKAWTENGRLFIENDQKDKIGHVVLWNTRTFPGDFLLEFGIEPQDPNKGLAIVFFAARARAGGSIFEPGLPLRNGIFPKYCCEVLNCYHVSYWACNEDGTPRRSTNMRKNLGFYLVASGTDDITGTGSGLKNVRLLKAGGKIRLETNGKISLAFDDDGTAYGPVWRDGCIGLRQMKYTVRAGYTYFKVWKIKK